LKDGHVYNALGEPTYLSELPTDDTLQTLQLAPGFTRAEFERKLGIEGRGNTICLIHDGKPNHIVSYEFFAVNTNDTLTHLALQVGCMGRFDDLSSEVLSAEWSRHGVTMTEAFEQSILKAAPEE
jgi:hypothetical protein